MCLVVFYESTGCDICLHEVKEQNFPSLSNTSWPRCLVRCFSWLFLIGLWRFFLVGAMQNMCLHVCVRVHAQVLCKLCAGRKGFLEIKIRILHEDTWRSQQPFLSQNSFNVYIKKCSPPKFFVYNWLYADTLLIHTAELWSVVTATSLRHSLYIWVHILPLHTKSTQLDSWHKKVSEWVCN